MKKEVLIFLFLLQIQLYAQNGLNISFSEVMFSPLETNGEFIEIYNSSEFPIDLSNYKIVYATSKADTLVSVNGGRILKPKTYSIILENDYDFLNGKYMNLIPDTALILQIDNGKFGSSGMANTSNRTIYLLNESSDTIDTYTYSANNPSGISDEKVNIELSNIDENWSNSLLENGTPGYKNSVAVRDYDLELTSLSAFPEVIFVEEEIEFEIKINNLGEKKATNFEVKLFVDLNNDTTLQRNEIIFEKIEAELDSKDSIIYSVIKTISNQGQFNLIAEVTMDKDEKTDNNRLIKTLLIRPKPNSYSDIIINEIMFKPKSDEPEWIEIFNRSGSPINIKDWRISDRTSRSIICDSSCFIGANEYAVLSEDETITNFYSINSKIVVMNLPSLNNTNDDLKIIDSLGRVIDSVNYKSKWGGGSGYSLERIDSEQDGNDSTNWNSSISNYFATPGEINSVTPREIDLTISDFRIANNYAKVGEDITVIIKAKNIGLTEIESYSILVFYDANNNAIADENELIINSIQNRIGIGDSAISLYNVSQFAEGVNRFIAKIFLENDENKANNEKTITFVGVAINEVRYDILINEIMYSPNSSESEWIEIFNNSIKTINLKNYKVADSRDTIQIIYEDFLINPNSYAVIADDSSFISQFEKNKNYTIVQFPNLNNSGDKIIILDSLNRVIDSLEYFSRMGGTNGYTLERISVEKNSIDSTNWRSSKTINGTPGGINSVSQKILDVELTEMFFFPAIPKFGEDVKIIVKLKNVGKQIAEFNCVLEEDVFLDSTILENRELSERIRVGIDDSINYEFVYTIESISKERAFIIHTAQFADEDTTNNILKKSIFPSVYSGSIVVNEIMYTPINGECEWIELQNSTKKTIDIKGFTISDIYTTPKVSVISDSSIYLKSKEFLIIAKDSTLSEYHKNLGCNVVVRKFANLNNDIDGVVLKDRFGEVVDSVLYKNSWGGNNGLSFERKLFNYSSVDSTNWGSSTDVELSTPGRKNSITPFEYDLSISQLELIPTNPIIGDEVKVKISITNTGLNTIDEYEVKTKYIKNGVEKFLENFSNSTLSPRDTSNYITSKSFILSDSVLVTATITCSVDENKTNDISSITVQPGIKRNTIIINEFFASPNNGCAEWFELFNTSGVSYDVSNWFVSDLLTTPSAKNIATTPIVIEGNGYLIITSDTSKYSFSKNANVVEVKFGALGNTEDGIILYDFNMNVVDSLRYDKNWEIRKGRSLERISAEVDASDYTNWLLSLDENGASPGISNSILETNPAMEKSIIINEIMYNPEMENSEFIEIYNRTETPINIGGWQLIDGNNNCCELSTTFFDVGASEYCVIASDSSIFKQYGWLKGASNVRVVESNAFSFSNSGESLVIIDHWGNVIDSIFYNPNWNNRDIANLKNKSLERISPQLGSNNSDNWSTSVSKYGATPGRVNSILTENNIRNNGITFSPNPFSPDNDGFEDFSIINYSLPYATAQIRIKVFDDKGRLVRTLANNEATANNGSIIFDGLNDEGFALPIGMYILFLEAADTKSGNIVSFKDVIVIARKL